MSSASSTSSFQAKISKSLAQKLSSKKILVTKKDPIDLTINVPVDRNVKLSQASSKASHIIDLSNSSDSSDEEKVTQVERVINCNEVNEVKPFDDPNHIGSDGTVHLFTYQEELQESIDDACAKLYQEWDCQLLMDMVVGTVKIPKNDVLKYV